MSQPEYIIKQESEVQACEATISTTAEGLTRQVLEGTLRGYQIGHLVLTNQNLYFVVTGFAEGFLARELASRTPFGIGRKIITGKKLSIQDVYKNLKNPGSIRIPLNQVLKIDYNKPFIGAPTISIAYRTNGDIKVYSFTFKGFGDRKDWKNAIENAVKQAGGKTDYAWWLEKTKPCPTCGHPMAKIPLANKWYCPQCKKYYQ